MKRPPPRTHPKPDGSELWPHLETIRAARRQRKTWAAIAEHLADKCGVRLSTWSVRNFFKRAHKGPLPLGFSDPKKEDVPTTTPIHSSPGSDVDLLLVEIAQASPFANLQRKYEESRRAKN